MGHNLPSKCHFYDDDAKWLMDIMDMNGHLAMSIEK